MIYRDNQKCSRVSWCVELNGHDGFHYGHPDTCEVGITKTRCAPPGADDTSVIECTTFDLPQWMKDGLRIGSALPGVYRLSWYAGAWQWLATLFTSATPKGGT